MTRVKWTRIAGWLGPCLALALLTGPAVAAPAPANLFQRVGFDQHLGARLPRDARFRDSTGAPVRLGELLQGRPVVLVLGYYECPNLCGLVWQGLGESLQKLKLHVGEDFDVIAVSIDPNEGPDLAAAKRESVLNGYGRPESAAGWHFLTGDEPQIRAVADAAGFRYVYDPKIDQYAHASGLVVATPDGRISRYLFGVRYAERNLRLALVESSGGGIGSPVDQLLLLCYHYDPATGQYGLLITNLLRAGGAVTVAGVLGFVVVSRRRERRAAARADGIPRART
jgi:protein SCO1/2